MKTYIFADRKQNSLGPLDRKYCPALLPVAGRPVIVHTIEDLVNAGVKHAYIIISAQAYEIEKSLGDGSRWGINLEYILSQGEELPSKVLKRQGFDACDKTLLIRGDILRSSTIAEFIKRSENVDADAIHAHKNNQLLGISYVVNKKNINALDKLMWPMSILQNCTDKIIELEHCSYSMLESVKDVFTTSKLIANNTFGRVSHTGYKTESGYIHGRNHKLGKSVSLSEHTCLGDNVFVGDNCLTEGHVTIGNNVMIDSDAHLKDCVVFPDTYIGNKTNIYNAIVFGNEIFKIDTGKSIHIKDDFLLSSLSNENIIITDRVMGLIILALSLPLWVIAAVFSYIRVPGEALIARQIISNKKIYVDGNTTVNLKIRVYEWNLPFRVLRYLPWLLKVISGDLRFIGANPQLSTDDPLYELMDDSKQPPQLGLISTASIELPHRTPDFEKRIHEILYDKKRSFISDMVYALSSLRHIFMFYSWRQNITTK